MELSSGTAVHWTSSLTTLVGIVKAEHTRPPWCIIILLCLYFVFMIIIIINNIQYWTYLLHLCISIALIFDKYLIKCIYEPRHIIYLSYGTKFNDVMKKNGLCLIKSTIQNLLLIFKIYLFVVHRNFGKRKYGVVFWRVWFETKNKEPLETNYELKSNLIVKTRSYMESGQFILYY